MASDAVVNLVVDATRAEGQTIVQLRRIVNDAERNAPAIGLNVQIDNASVVRAVNRLDTTVSDAANRINDSLRDGFADLGSLLGPQLDILNDHLSSMGNQLDEINRSLNDVDRNDPFPTLTRNAGDADRETNRLSGTLGTIGRSAGSIAGVASRLTLIGAAAGGAVPLVAGLATTVANIAPAAAAGVTAFVALKGATATLKLALTGVQEAITAVFDPDADPAALAEALERLAPEARSFVLELQKMKPAFDALRIDVQNRVFRGLDTELGNLSSSAFPTLRTAARSFADTFNAMARNTVTGAQQLSAEGSLGKALKSGTTAFGNLERIPGQVLVAVGRLAAAGGPLLIRFSESVADTFDNLTKKIGDAFESGALEDAVNAAGDTLSQLGDIAGNVGEILSNVFSAASESGGGLFTTLESITEAMAEFTASTEFQDALSALMDLFSTLVETILPVLSEAFTALLPVIETLVPPIQELIEALGGALMEIIPELAPVLQELAGVFVEIIEAVTPLIPPLLEIIEDILPLLIFFLRGTAEIVENVLGPALLFLIEGLANVVDALRSMAGGTLRDYVIPIIQIFIDLLNGDFTSAQQAAAGATRRLIDSQKAAWTDGLASVARFVRDMGVSLISGSQNASRGFLSSIRDMLGNFGRQLGQIPAIARSQLNGMGRVLVDSGAQLVRGFINGMLSQLSGIRDAASRLVSAARDYFPFSPAKRGPFSGKGWTLYSGRATGEAFAQGLKDTRDEIQRTLGSLLQGSVTPGMDLSAAGASLAGSTGITPGGSFERTAPSVNVFLGNELVRQFVRVEINENNQERDRQAAQGVRF